MPPRFRKAILLPFLHPTVKGIAVEANPSTISDERQLTPVDPVIDRMTRHAEVLRGRPNVEPP
jgi:hypothetical protein